MRDQKSVAVACGRPGSVACVASLSSGVATTTSAPKKTVDDFKSKGVAVVQTKPKAGMVDLKDLMKQLGSMGIVSVMIEGGSELNSTAIKEGLVDKICMFTAPKIVGSGKGAIGDLQADRGP